MKQPSTHKKQPFLKNFAAAFSGLKCLYTGERNFCIHSVVGVLVITAGFLFRIASYEWLAILLVIGLVLCAEAINAGIERLCDHITPEYNPKIKDIKDIAAGAVLVCAFISVIVGGVIFIPYMMKIILP